MNYVMISMTSIKRVHGCSFKRYIL